MHILLARGGLNVMTLLGTFPSGIAQGMIWGIMALGVYITFRMLDIADLTVDGSFTTGGAVAVMLITSGTNCWIALAAASVAGLLAGLTTGILHTRLGIPAILSGILTQFALYSINLAIMGFSANKAVSVDRYVLAVSSRYINAALITGVIIAVALVSVLYWYFGTEHGSAMRATGNNPDMSKALGININSMKVIGLALSNALVAFSGGLMAQYQGFADINMGRGAIVIEKKNELLWQTVICRIRWYHLLPCSLCSFMAEDQFQHAEADDSHHRRCLPCSTVSAIRIPCLFQKSGKEFAQGGQVICVQCWN